MEFIHNLTKQTERFAMEIIGLPIPETPTRLDTGRKDWALSALTEELTEFRDATTLEEEADALIDLSYFALGRIVEMGLAPSALFEEVHNANMRKVRGELSKRPNARGYDATKPEGWTPPFLAPLLTARLEHVLLALEMQKFEDYSAGIPKDFVANQVMTGLSVTGNWNFPAPPKILVLGYARHGKDEAARILADKYGLRHVSSSMFCAERVVMPALAALSTINPNMPQYANAEECFNDRSNHRSAWFDLIKAFNYPDLTNLGRAIYEEHDVYVGLRNAAEFHALKNMGVYDLCIWIDRSEHQPPEDRSSCTVEPWMADFAVDNNGTLEDLDRNLSALMDRYLTEIGAQE